MSERTLVDSNVLLDIVTGDPVWEPWSSAALASALDTGTVAINAIIFAQVSTGFSRIEELDDALPPAHFIREELPWSAGFLAGKAFLQYRRRGGARRSPLPDFYIGAHAAVAGYRLLTRDVRRYITYFPTLQLIAPTS
ncbi:MAG TPA: type II toxin-antitoxin system VapC family toxin [Microbacterium sp.]|nr:type II toxin-antitoxin system VapC family toxin [Microbacterium sp.]